MKELEILKKVIKKNPSILILLAESGYIFDLSLFAPKSNVGDKP